MKSLRSSFAVVAALAAGWIGSGSLIAQNPSAPGTGTVEAITVHGKSLEGNLEGDTPDRPVFVYLPPSYASNPARRYPVVYLLHGYGLTGQRWMSFANVAKGSDAAIAGGMREMIVVSPDAYTLWNGSMYSNSTATGDWEGFIAQDLVTYVDSHYRTIPDRASRGLAGHSMGGYGTFRIGMKYPQVFSSLYPMSSCCLGANLNPNPQQFAAFEAAKSPEEIKAASQTKGKDGKGKGGGFNFASLASAAAWSANPKNAPFYFDLPVKEGAVRPEIVAKWAANAPLSMVDQYVPQLKRYQAIAMDVGLQDNLLTSNRAMDALLTQAGVPHTFETYEGDHNNRVPERIEKWVLPFFSKNLRFQ